MGKDSLKLGIPLEKTASEAEKRQPSPSHASLHVSQIEKTPTNADKRQPSPSHASLNESQRTPPAGQLRPSSFLGDCTSSDRGSEVSGATPRAHSPCLGGFPSVGTLVLRSAEASEQEEMQFHDIDNDILIIDPTELNNEELQEFISSIAESNKTIESEVWLFEKFWTRTRHVPGRGTPENPQQSTASDSKTSLREYEELVRCSDQKQESTFKECQMCQNDKITSTSVVKKSGVSSQRISTIGTEKANGLFSTKMSTRSRITTVSNSSADVETTLGTEQKMDIAIHQVRRMKEEKTDRREIHEKISRNKNSTIEQHKEHLKALQSYRLLFTREHNRGGGMSGDAIVKFYDDVIKHENHTKENIRLNNHNLKTKGKWVENNIRMREEGGDNFKLVDYQKLELINDGTQQEFDELGTVMANLKKTLGDCNFHCNAERKRLRIVKEEAEKLGKEITMRRSILTQVENELRTIEAAKNKLNKDHKEIRDLTKEYSTPAVIDYVQEMATNRRLKNDVRSWERQLNLLRLSLKELSTTLRKLESSGGDHDDDNRNSTKGTLKRLALTEKRTSKANLKGRSGHLTPRSLPPIGRTL